MKLGLSKTVLAICVLGIFAPTLPAKEGVTKRVFGKTPNGQSVTLYSLTNEKGMRVSIMDWGATVVNLFAPDREGKMEDVALGFDTFRPYLAKDNPYFGCTVGRYANRIDKGKFSLDGKTYQLSANDHGNLLHGGAKGFDKHMWKAEVLKTEPPTVRFTRISPDGEQGFPGNLEAQVTFTLLPGNALQIDYRATTDAATIVNMTNHTYFNLAGAGNGKILDHVLTLHAGAYTPVNATLIPTGELRPVAGTPMDFKKPTAIGERLLQAGGNPIGYDHNWVIARGFFGGMTLDAVLNDPKTGRWMKTYSDQPGIQFYSGNFLDSTVAGKGGKIYPQYSGLCLEPQHFPDSPNQSEFPSTVLRPGQVYQARTVYAFGTSAAF